MSDSLVIIPTYNEKENIEAVIKSIFSLSHSFDVLVVDDNSPDGTGNLVRNMQDTLSQMEIENKLFLMERESKEGLGTAYITGFNFALDHGYEYIFEMDADFSHDPGDLIYLYRTCSEDGYDLAIGSRYVSGVNVVNWPIGRVLLSYLASIYVKFITGMPIKDATAGFKCYRCKVLKAIDFGRIHSVGYAFQIEMKFTAWKYGFKIKEIPIIFKDRMLGKSKMSINIFQEALLGVLRMKINSLFRSYQYVHTIAEPVKQHY